MPCPTRWLGSWAVVTLPQEIDVSNSQQVGQELASLVDQGAVMLIVDMTASTFCDTSGARELIAARKHAHAGGAEIRLVVTAQAVLRVFEIIGLGDLFDIFPDLATALSGLPAAGEGPDATVRARSRAAGPPSPL
jgi:anti-sigma B factor antagonist